MQHKPNALGQQENHKFADVASQFSSSHCRQAKIVVCHENFYSVCRIRFTWS